MIVIRPSVWYYQFANKQNKAKTGGKKQVRKIKLAVFDWAGTTVDYGCVAPDADGITGGAARGAEKCAVHGVCGMRVSGT